VRQKWHAVCVGEADGFVAMEENIMDINEMRIEKAFAGFILILGLVLCFAMSVMN
jgi:hypothetical protein